MKFTSWDSLIRTAIPHHEPRAPSGGVVEAAGVRGDAGQELEKDSRQQVGLATEMVGKLIFTFVF